MSKVVGGSIGLNSELKFRDYFLIYGNLKSDIANGLRICEPALDFSDPVPLSSVVFHKFLYLVDCFDDVLHLEEHALPPDHIADLEGYFLFLLEDSVNGLFVLIILALISFLNGLLCLFVKFLLFPEEHLLFDSDHCFFVGFVWVEFQSYFGLNCQFEACLPDKLFEIVLIPLGY